MKATGKIQVVTQDSAEDTRVEHQIREEMNAAKLFKVEQYLNGKVAVEIFQKFGVLIRVHF